MTSRAVYGRVRPRVEAIAVPGRTTWQLIVGDSVAGSVGVRVAGPTP